MGSIYSTDSIDTELQALVRGLRIAVDHKITPLEVSVDCEEFIHYLKNDHPTYSNIIADCRDLMS